MVKPSEEIIREFTKLSWANRSVIKEIAVQALLDKGEHYPTTQHINNSIVSLYNSCGSFDVAIESAWDG